MLLIEVLVETPLREGEMNDGMKSFTNLTSQLSAFRFFDCEYCGRRVSFLPLSTCHSLLTPLFLFLKNKKQNKKKYEFPWHHIIACIITGPQPTRRLRHRSTRKFLWRAGVEAFSSFKSFCFVFMKMF
jgi:hypothetical protein